MSSTYSGVGFKSFIKRLKDGLDNRLEQFYRETLEEYKDDPEAIQSCSLKEWMELYKQWSDRKILQKIAEEYILGDEKDT